MKKDAIARPFGLALGICVCTGCVVPSPLGGVETETDGGTQGGSGTDGMTSMGSTAGDSTETGVDTGPAPVGPPAIDILFVFDNSGSMGEEQGALATSIDSMVTALEQVEGLSYRIGVTTTDNGNPWCLATGPEAGRMHISSCRERTSQFVFNGNPPYDAGEVACTDVCTLESIPLLPTTTDFDTEARPRPWIEGGSTGSNLDGVAITDALRCALPQGIAGCGFESPLEAARKAVLRSAEAGDAQYGFMRPEAHLAIIFVSDETDCSHANEFESIFLPEDQGGNGAFWSDPEASGPTSAVCWNAGVQCTGGPGVYEECHAANYDVNRNVGVAGEAAVLVPVDEYRDFFAGLLAAKRDVANASVFMFGVVGVPPGYPANELVYADAVDPGTQSDFGIGPGCESEYGTALPPVRERELIESFQYEGMTSNLYSICQPPLSDVYSLIIGQLGPYLGG